MAIQMQIPELARFDRLRRVVGTDRAVSMVGGYEAADRLERDLAGWQPHLSPPDLDVLRDKDLMDARARDMFQNDGVFRSGVQLQQNLVVGHQFRFVANPRLDVLGLADDPTWADEFRAEIENKFTLWAESFECYLDARGMSTLTEIVRLAVAVEVLTGEFLMAFNWLSDRDRGQSPYRTAVLPVELDRLRTPPEYMSDPRVVKGVRTNRHGRPIGVYIWKRHPNDYRFPPPTRPGDRDWNYYRMKTPWGRRKILYLRSTVRPEQVRGVSDLVAALREGRLLEKFRLVTLQNAIANASIAAVIESDMPPEVALASLGGHAAGAGGDAYISAAQRYLQAVGQFVRGAQHLTVDGVKIPHLFPGSKLNLQPAGRIGGVGQDFEVSLLRHMASVLNVSYEELARDFSRTNYSSARAAMQLTKRSLLARRRFVAERVANSILRAWFEEAAQLPPERGGLETLRYSKAPDIYEGMNLDAYTAGRWMGATQGHIDPLKEAQAMALMVREGLMTMEDAQAQLGQDWRDVLEQLRREKAIREEYGLDHPGGNSPEMNAVSGAPRATNPTPGGDSGGDTGSSDGSAS